SIGGSLPSRQIGISHESRDKMALKPQRHSSRTRGGPRRIHDIGINIYSSVDPGSDEGGLVSVTNSTFLGNV
ncbi:unnamed protein product, partial [Ascophyllum nodosum]